MADLKKKFLFQFLLAASQILFPLITYPYITRSLGPEGLGRVGYIDFMAGFVITIFSIGIPYYGVREIAKARSNKLLRSKITSELLAIHFIFSLAGIVVFALLILLNKNFHHENSLMLLGCFYILLQTFSIEWYLQGVEAFEFIAMRSIIIRMLGIVAILLFIKNSSDYPFYYLIIVLTQALVAIAALVKMLRENKFSLRGLNFMSHTKPLFYFFLTSSFISIYVFFDTIILGWLTDKTHVGYYTLGLRIIKLPLVLLVTLNTVLYPRISFLQAEADEKNISRLSKFSTNFIVTIITPVCFCFYLLAPEIVSLFGGKNFDATIPIIQLLSPLPLLISLTTFFTMQVMAPLHKEKWIMIAVLIACMVSLSLNFWLIPFWQEQGAAVAALVTESTACLITLSFAYKEMKSNFSISHLLIALLLSAMTIPLVILLRSYLNSPFYILSISLAVFGIAYISFQYFIFKNEVITVMIHFAKEPFLSHKKQFADAEGI